MGQFKIRNVINRKRKKLKKNGIYAVDILLEKEKELSIKAKAVKKFFNSPA